MPVVEAKASNAVAQGRRIGLFRKQGIDHGEDTRAMTLGVVLRDRSLRGCELTNRRPRAVIPAGIRIEYAAVLGASAVSNFRRRRDPHKRHVEFARVIALFAGRGGTTGGSTL